MSNVLFKLVLLILAIKELKLECSDVLFKPVPPNLAIKELKLEFSYHFKSESFLIFSSLKRIYIHIYIDYLVHP